MSPPEASDSTGVDSPQATTDSTGVDSPQATTDSTGVDSRWWYVIAAVPVHFVVSVLVGGLLFGSVFLGLWFDPHISLGLLAIAVVFFLGLPGLALSVLFPVALYVDAGAIADAGVEWDPDPALYGLLGAAGVVLTAFVVSVPLALYYLYRRHEAVGVP